ncbi:MAG: hypothetical protein LUF25_00715 [Phascolarctobacterium sp.]|nr:hypothetical protein [Phascolarctobacterium sp.]
MPFEEEEKQQDEVEEKKVQLNLAYDAAFARQDPACRGMDDVHKMSVTGKSIIGSMGTQMKMPGWDDILILGAQLNPPSLEDHAEV